MFRIVDLLQLFSNIAGLLGFGIAVAVAIFAARSGIMKAASDAQGSAIGAMRGEIETLRERIDDAEKENHRLNQTIETIYSALKKHGLIITVQGEMVSIEDKRGKNTTTTRIRPVRLTKQEADEA